MASYLIHAVPSRMWYVNDYLIPSMLEQGIVKENITVFVDDKKMGNLRACMKAFSQVPEDGGTWHLQDDVIISHDFKEKTEQYDDGIVCGFASKYDNPNVIGQVNVREMWFSFPCIRIPNKIARDCATWCELYMLNNPVYSEYTKNGANDDWIFRRYIWDKHKTERPLNLVPNIVDHIDYLIGGQVREGIKRSEPVRSKHWTDEYLVEQLKEKLEA